MPSAEPANFRRATKPARKLTASKASKRLPQCALARSTTCAHTPTVATVPVSQLFHLCNEPPARDDSSLSLDRLTNLVEQVLTRDVAPALASEGSPDRPTGKTVGDIQWLIPNEYELNTMAERQVRRQTEATMTAAASVGASPRIGPIRVFVVDDSPPMVTAMVSILRSLPNVVVAGTASSGQQALEQAGQLRLDVVITDLDMPGMDGLQLTKELLVRFPQLCVVITTVHDIQTFRAAATDSGAHLFIGKSRLFEELSAFLQREFREERQA